MRHVTEGELLAYLDGELSGPEATRLTTHLRECAECRGRLEELRSAAARLEAALRRLDAPPPRSLRPPVVPFRRARDERRPSRSSGGAAAGSTARRWWIAAALVLAAGTAAAAVPGSPVREFIERSLDLEGRDPITLEAPGAPATEAGSGGETAVAIRPGRALLVSIREPSDDTRVRIRLVDDARATVRSAGARYRTARDRIEVLGPESGALEIAIPRDVPRARVEVDGKVLVRKEGPDLRVLTPADTADSEILFRLGAAGRTP